MACDRAQSALAWLESLHFSVPAPRDGRDKCPSCGRAVRLYCATCLHSVVPLPEPLQLPLPVLILRHPKEPAAKSSAPGLALLSDCALRPSADALLPGTWLVFPTEKALEASAVDWSEVKGLVLLDSRWKHAKAMLADDASADIR